MFWEIFTIMRNISNTDGSNCIGEASSENRSFAETPTGEDSYQDLINLANTVPLIKLFKNYNLHCNAQYRSMKCPFLGHKGGRENSASFYYYQETNSFYCFGCGVGGKNAHAPRFMSAMEDISIVKAAKRIISLYKDDVGVVCESTDIDYVTRLKSMLQFSSAVRNFYQSYSSNEAIKHVELTCKAYDDLMLKHSNDKELNNEALQRSIDQFIKYLMDYNE